MKTLVLRTVYSIGNWVHKQKTAIVNVLVLFSIFIIQVICISEAITAYHKANQFVQKVTPILEEMDTTYTLRNYEVMRLKLHNETKEWLYDE